MLSADLDDLVVLSVGSGIVESQGTVARWGIEVLEGR